MQIYKNEADIRRLVQSNYKLGQRIYNKIVETIEKIKSTLGISSITDTARYAELKELEQGRKMFQKCLDEAKEGTSNTGGVRYSIETIPGTKLKYVKFSRDFQLSDNIEEWSSEIEDYINNIIIKNGSVDIPTNDGDIITLNERTAWKIADVKKIENGERIEMSEDELRLKYEAGAHIDELIKISKKGDVNEPDDGSHEWADEWNYRTVFFEDSKGDYYRLKISVGIKDDVLNAYNLNKFRKRSTQSSGSSSGTSTGGALNEDASRKVVYQTSSDKSREKTIMELAYEKAMQKKQEKNNSEKYSFADEQTNTEAFKKWFGNSKIVNDDGTPKIVYHGTNEDFEAFDRTKGRSGMDIQGMFFSPWEIDAAGYGSNVGAYYLNIRNPAPEGIAYKALNMFKGQNYAGIKAREYLERLGYDGVNNSDEEYIAFYPEQIKSATDNIGTYDGNDKRYRYSFKDEEQQKREYTPAQKRARELIKNSIAKELKRIKC